MPFAGGVVVGGADGHLEQVALQRVEAVGVVAGVVVADQQGVQPDQVGDLLRRRPRRVGDVPGVDGVLVLGGADGQVLGAGDQRAQEGVVAGPVEHVAAHAVGQTAGQQHVDGERLAAAALGVDQHRAVVVGRVERVEQLDRAARLGERERHPGRRAAAGAHQRQASRRRCGSRTCASAGPRRGPSGSEDCHSSGWRSWPWLTRASEAAVSWREACSTASASCTGSGSGPRSRIDW